MNTNVSILLIAFIALAGCDRAKPKQTKTEPQKPASFRDTFFTSITPTADGGAYATGLDSGLWYLRASQAVKVRFPDLPAEADRTFAIGLEITPLLDGGAYAHSLLEKSFWYLRADTAQQVTEVPSLSNAPVTSPMSAFPLYIAERQKRLRAHRHPTSEA